METIIAKIDKKTGHRITYVKLKNELNASAYYWAFDYPKTCTIKDCNRKHVARGFCKKHWRQWYCGKLKKDIDNQV